MQWRNTARAYGLTAKILHWGMAALVLGQLAVGLYMTGMPLSPDKLMVYGWHKSFGVLILGLAALRLSWRLANARVAYPPMPKLLILAAHASHWALYGLLFALPLTGWAMSSAAGFPVPFFGWFTLPDLVAPGGPTRTLMASLHETLAYVFMLLIAVHASAALWHHFVRRDDVLRRMGFSRQEGL